MSHRARQFLAAVVMLALSFRLSHAGIVADIAARLAEIAPTETALEMFDDALPAWLADMARDEDHARGVADALARAEQWGGIGGAAVRVGCAWRVSYALANREEIELARSIAHRAIRAAADAERSIEAARLTSDDDTIRDLARRGQAVLPLNAARSLILLASCDPRHGNAKQFLELAGELLSRPTGAGVWYETERATLGAMAMALSDRASQAFEAVLAAEQMAELIQPADDTPASRAERVLARAFVESRAKSPASGRSVLRSAIDQPPFLNASGRDWFASVIAASMHARLSLIEAATSTDARTRDALLAQALVLFERLVVQARTPTQAMPVLEEAARAIDRDARLGQENDLGVVIASIMRPDRPVQTARLTRLIDAQSLPSSVAANAEIVLIRELASSDDPDQQIEASRRAVAFAQRHDTDPRATQMLEWGVSLAISLAGGSDSSREAAIARTLEHAINTAPTSSHADLWRTQLAASLARRALEASDEEAASFVDQAVETLEQRRTKDATAGALLLWIAQRIEVSGGDGSTEYQRALDATRGVTTDEACRVRVRALVGLAQDQQSLDEAVALRPDRLGDATTAAVIALVRLNRSNEAAPLIESLDSADAAYLGSRLTRLAWAQTSPLIGGFVDELRERSDRPSPWQDGAWRVVDAMGAGDDARTAWGLLIAGAHPRAAALFASVIESQGETPALTRGLGEALLASGDDAGAFAAFRRLAQLTEHDKSSRDYWHAQTRLAEILVSQNADASRTDTIARLIRRLRAEPGWNAHADCARRLARIAQSVGATD